MGIGILLLSGLLSTGQSAPSDTVALNERGFNIPVRLLSTQIREVILFESADQGKSWNQKATNPPTKESFAVTVPADGLYWYSLTVVDLNGQREPSDPSKAPRMMKVLVDTKKPDVKLAAARQGEGVVAEWTIQEENPKLSTFKLEYRTADMPANRWVVVDAKAQLSGRAGFTVVGTAAITVRLSLLDEAENAGSNQVEIAAGAPPIGVPVPAAQGGPGATTDGGIGSPFPAQAVGMVRNQSRVVPDSLEPITNSGGGPAVPPPSGGSTSSGAIAATGAQNPSLGSPGGNVPAPPRGPVSGLEYVNTNRVNVKYTVDKIGASGLGSVDLYVTRDDGATWQRLTGEQLPAAPGLDGTTPAERSLAAELPGEGRYGFYLIVRSGVGLGKQPPRNGDRPHMRLEVDLTPPEGTLYGLQPVQGQTNAVVVRWKASDLNLADKPIRLEWSERKGGPWTRIGDTDLPNTGSYLWKLPDRIAGKVYLKMTITDLAGNTGVAESAEPVTIDLTEPEARIIGLGR
jgi:hypothetical protein